jgi:hypothetical protein
MSGMNYKLTAVGKDADKVDSLIESLIENRRRYLCIVTALLDDYEHKRNIVPSDETRYLFPMMNLWKNYEFNKWINESRGGGLSEKHVLQTIGWMYDHLILMNGVSKTDIAKCLLASGCLRDYSCVGAIRANITKRVPNNNDALIRSVVTLEPAKC